MTRRLPKVLRRPSAAPGRRYTGRRLALALILALAAACGDSTGTAIASPEGRWSGNSEGIWLSLLLSEPERTSLMGAGNIATPTQSHAVTVTGTHVHPHVSLNLSIAGFQNVNFQGRFEGAHELVGVLNGSGFDDFAITLERHR